MTVLLTSDLEKAKDFVDKRILTLNAHFKRLQGAAMEGGDQNQRAALDSVHSEIISLRTQSDVLTTLLFFVHTREAKTPLLL